MNDTDRLRHSGDGVASPPVARLEEVTLRYKEILALDSITLSIPSARLVGFIGPDGVGKSSLLSLVAGARRVQEGRIEVLGRDVRNEAERFELYPSIAFMPQGLGKNLYATLSVFENVNFFGRMFGLPRAEREQRIYGLLESTGLGPFADRAAGNLSGGMKQKLGLCCALVHEPELLILDEPTTGIDPLSRRQFWELISRLREQHPSISILTASAYMDEAERFDWLIALDSGRVLAAGTPVDLLRQTGAASLERAFVALLPEAKRRGAREIHIPPRTKRHTEVAIEARGLTKRFGEFVAVDHVTFRIERGEIFGFLGSNGSGKTTTMKMLTGLLPPSEGKAWLFGQEVRAEDLETRYRVGYMSQSFSLYSELTVRQNLVLHARLFRVPEAALSERVAQMLERFDLEPVANALPSALPLGVRQRLSLAVAVIHQPELLILDEPTSGVDPIARDSFWELLIELSRRELVTIFISTHFVNEAERCDRISLMHAGKVLVSDTPERIIERGGVENLEQAFIGYLERAVAGEQPVGRGGEKLPTESPQSPKKPGSSRFRLDRLLSYARREALELRRDPIRATMALAGSFLLMLITAYGINVDVENLTFAVLDRDRTTRSENYVTGIAGSRYFTERRPILDYDDLDRRMRSGKLSVAIEIPPGFGRDLARNERVEVGVWIDGAMPQRAETVRGFVEGMHQDWLAALSRRTPNASGSHPPVVLETRFRYNPSVKSIVAMAPAVIPLLLLLIPAILSALSVVREKELGSIVNFFVTPATRLEFLLGKQLPYVLLGMVNFFILSFTAVFAFGVPFKGSFLTLTAAALVYVVVSTAMGLVISSFVRSQIAAIFATALLTIVPASQFSGLIDPVSSLDGGAAIMGRIYPTTYFLNIARGTFSKGLGFADLLPAFLPLLIAAPVLLWLAVRLLKKQEA